MAHNPGNKILDLGCGDGIITHELLQVDGSIEATLVDGSGDMLKNARERLKGFHNSDFIKASFQDILDKKVTLREFDFVVSSLAIHHLSLEEKRTLLRAIYDHLNVDGYFLNIDVILAPTETLEQWYLSLWRDWITERKTMLAIAGNDKDDVIQRYKDNKDNRPDTLDEQLSALTSIGFRDVDCYYKYGIFAMFGGKK